MTDGASFHLSPDAALSGVRPLATTESDRRDAAPAFR
jgi:hypothetical protein